MKTIFFARICFRFEIAQNKLHNTETETTKTSRNTRPYLCKINKATFHVFQIRASINKHIFAFKTPGGPIKATFLSGAFFIERMLPIRSLGALNHFTSYIRAKEMYFKTPKIYLLS